jgi:predicted Rossmann-fold nucleotide-binding protein
MTAVSKAFAETPGRTGLVLGIVPCAAAGTPEVPKPGYPNDWVEVPIRTHLHLSGVRGEEPGSRNHLVVLTATVLVALPGGAGTASEVQLARRYNKPIIAHLKSRDEIPGLPPEVRVEAELDRVTEFVLEAIATFE